MNHTPKWKVVVVQPERPKSSSRVMNEVPRFVALEDGRFIIGISDTYSELINQCRIQTCGGSVSKIFAQGIRALGGIEFEGHTPLKKQNAICYFLAGQALQLAISYKEVR